MKAGGWTVRPGGRGGITCKLCEEVVRQASLRLVVGVLKEARGPIGVEAAAVRAPLLCISPLHQNPMPAAALVLYV
jgi:hypothetical protein